MDQDIQDQINAQKQSSIEQQSQAAAVKAQMQQEQKRIKNPEFLKQLQEADLDSDVWDWLEAEIGPALSGSHILGVRDESYEDQQHLLNRNKAERWVAEGSPGRLLKENEEMLAQAQGVTGWEQGSGPEADPQYRAPHTSSEKRVLRGAAEVITTRQTLSIGGRGVDAVSTATVENRTVTNEEEEASGVTGRAKEVFK